MRIVKVVAKTSKEKINATSKWTIHFYRCKIVHVFTQNRKKKKIQKCDVSFDEENENRKKKSECQEMMYSLNKNKT